MNRAAIFCVITFFLLIPFRMEAQKKFQVGTNALGLVCLGTLNAEFDVALQRHWTLGLSGRYNPFTYGDISRDRTFQLRQRSVALSARWWPWYVYSGWWLSGKVQWQEYNAGGIISQRTEEGQRYGAGVTAGYSHMLAPHVNLEFGLGLWGGVKQYSVYSCPTCGTRLEDGVKAFVLPNDIILAVSYVF